MHDSENNPEALISVPSDLEAAMIVSALAARGIDASTSGEFTSGFRAEAPGMVKVLVRRSDLTLAQEALDELAAEKPTAASSTANTHLATSTLIKMAVFILLSLGILQSCF